MNERAYFAIVRAAWLITWGLIYLGTHIAPPGFGWTRDSGAS